MHFIDTFLRQLTAYRGESCLQKYAGCQSAFSQLLFSTRTLLSFSATCILASTCSLFFLFLSVPITLPHAQSRPSSLAMQAQQGSAQPIQHTLKVSAPIHCLLAQALPGDPLFSCRQSAITGLIIHLHAEKTPKYCKTETITRASQPRRAASGASAPSLPPAALPVPSGHSPLGTTSPPGRGERIRVLIRLPSAGACAWGSHTGWGKDSCPRSWLSGATRAPPLQQFTALRYLSRLHGCGAEEC